MTFAHSDPPRVDTSIELLVAAASGGRDLLEGMRLSSEAVICARHEEAGDAVLGQALLLQAHYAYRRFDYTLAYESALEASAALRRCDDVGRLGQALNYCVITCIETGDVVHGLKHSIRALALAEAENNLSQQAKLVHNQAVIFEMLADHKTALEHLERAARLFERVPNGQAGVFFARVNAAGIHLTLAESPTPRGMPQREAEATVLSRRAAAAQELPDLLPQADPAALQMWLAIQMRLGNMDAARLAAAICIGAARRNRWSERYRTHAMLGLADYHLGHGRAHRCVLCLKSAVRKLRAARNRSHLAATERRLAAVYAHIGDHQQALWWMRQAEHDNARVQTEFDQLRRHIGESHRQAERRRSLREDVPVHVQRLDVIGRLISEVHHALAQPIGTARATLQRLIDATDPAASPKHLGGELQEIIEQIDAASSLVRQLKMFSYRATPQPSEVDLELAITQSWKDASLWRRDCARKLTVIAPQRTVVHVDAQRLAVLLNILLIEANRMTAPHELFAYLDRDATTCRMKLSLAVAPLDVKQVCARVGITLCAEIANEVGGRLTCEAEPERGVALLLKLPLMSSA